VGTLLKIMPGQSAAPTRRGFGSFLRYLLDAQDIPAFAARAGEYLSDQGLTGVMLGWRLGTGELDFLDQAALRPEDRGLAIAARRNGGWAFDDAARRCPGASRA
jgi:hypothetical protein